MSDRLYPDCCTRCELAKTRKHVVISRGAIAAKFVIVGEAPGEDEDNQGLPFVGRSGRLLDKCLRTVGIPPEAILITNLVRCRPPENRNPTPMEIGECTAWLDPWLRNLQPRVVIALGRFSIGYFKGYTTEHIQKMTVRHEVGYFFGSLALADSARVIGSYHPSYALRSGGWVVEAILDHFRRAKAEYNRLSSHL